MVITESGNSEEPRSLSHNYSHHQSNPNLNTDPDDIDFDECLKDSPRFRQNLNDHLNYVDYLETCMGKTIKYIGHYVDTGRDHIKSQRDFINTLRVLSSSLGSNNSELTKRFDILLGTLEEILRLNEIVIDQSARTIGTSLNTIINDDILKIKEARKSFDKISHEYDTALNKHSQPIKKQQDDYENLLIATSTAFSHTSLDLSIQLTSFKAKKSYELLSSILSFTKAFGTYFHEGSELFGDLKPHIDNIDVYMNESQDKYECLSRNLPSKHLMVSNNELKPLSFNPKLEEVYLEGYLYKRASNGFKGWNRRWFILRNHQLLYQKRCDTQPSIMEDDLRLLTVRPIDRSDDRRYCFEILSPHKSHILQADSMIACRTWISAIQAGINAAYHDSEYRVIRDPYRQQHNHQQHQSNSNYNSNHNKNNDFQSGGSWSSGFSFKALQQQATSRINSMTSSESKLDGQISQKSISSSSSVKQHNKPDTNIQSNETKHDHNGSQGFIEDEEEDGEEDDMMGKTDELGRSYAPLRGDDYDDYHAECSKEKATSNNSISTTNTTTDIASSQHVAPIKIGKELKAPPDKPQRAYKIILAMPGNELCADCGAENPQWASTNLGITLCIQCAGIHRSLGVHLSKVRSLILDIEVWSPEIVNLMLNLGNNLVNGAYLACYRDQIPRINADSARPERESWIKAKYLLKSFMKPPGCQLNDSLTHDLKTSRI